MHGKTTLWTYINAENKLNIGKLVWETKGFPYVSYIEIYCSSHRHASGGNLGIAFQWNELYLLAIERYTPSEPAANV